MLWYGIYFLLLLLLLLSDNLLNYFFFLIRGVRVSLRAPLLIPGLTEHPVNSVDR